MVLERTRFGSTEVLKLNRPEQRNALSPELVEGISAALAEMKMDDTVRCVVITAAGDRAFCAGMDLKAFADAQSSDAPPRDPALSAEYRDLSAGLYPKPVIAAVNATAVAGGFELVMACDLVVASDQAKFGIPEAKRGLYAAGGGYTLPARIPLAVALELGLTGDYIDALEAQRLGLINRVVAPEAVLTAALALADRVAANGPLAVAATKKLMRTVAERGVAAAREQSAQIQKSVFSSADALEGARAFTERRDPQWTGR